MRTGSVRFRLGQRSRHLEWKVYVGFKHVNRDVGDDSGNRFGRNRSRDFIRRSTRESKVKTGGC